MDKHKNIAREYWEKTSKNSPVVIETNPAREVEWKAIRKFFNIDCKREKKIVDLACGTGYHAVRFIQEGFSVAGIDVSPSSLEVLRRRVKLIKKEDKLLTIETDLIKPILENNFDAGYIISSYHCLALDKKERQTILRNFVKMIKLKGSFFMMEPNPFNPLFVFFYPFIYRKNWREGINVINSRASVMKKDLSKAGIGDLCFYHYGFLPTFLINKFSFVETFNRFCCKIPFVKNISAFNLIVGKRVS